MLRSQSVTLTSFGALTAPARFTGPYQNFAELGRFCQEGVDFKICARKGTSGAALIAIHGGSIEFGTSEIAVSAAGERDSFYSFIGLANNGEAGRLHIASTKFDEPQAIGIVSCAAHAVSIHGCPGQELVVYLGGLDYTLRNLIGRELKRAGIRCEFHANRFIQGINPENICNRTRTGSGVQLELPAQLRELFLTDRDFAASMSGAIRSAVATALAIDDVEKRSHVVR